MPRTPESLAFDGRACLVENARAAACIPQSCGRSGVETARDTDVMLDQLRSAKRTRPREERSTACRLHRDIPCYMRGTLVLGHGSSSLPPASSSVPPGTRRRTPARNRLRRSVAPFDTSKPRTVSCPSISVRATQRRPWSTLAKTPSSSTRKAEESDSPRAEEEDETAAALKTASSCRCASRSSKMEQARPWMDWSTSGRTTEPRSIDPRPNS